MTRRPGIDAPLRRVIRADGLIEIIDAAKTVKEIAALIGAQDSGLDTVNLRNGMVMLVDDLGYDKNLEPNATATALYHKVCVPGTTHLILGDVAIVPDADFGVR
jgi:hypothetical protein